MVLLPTTEVGKNPIPSVSNYQLLAKLSCRDSIESLILNLLCFKISHDKRRDGQKHYTYFFAIDHKDRRVD